MKKMSPLGSSFLLCLLFLQGCGGLPVQYGTLMTPMDPAASKILENREEAIAVIKGLNDGASFWNLKGLQDATVSTYSVDLTFNRKTVVTLPNTSISYSANIFSPDSRLVQKSDSQVVSDTYHQTILFTDVKGINLIREKIISSDLAKNSADDSAPSYQCYVSIMDQVPFVAESTSEKSILRVAEAFSILTGVPVTTIKKFPNQGLILNAETGQVIGQYLGSLFERSKLALFDYISAVDSATEQTPKEVFEAVRKLGPGKHFLQYYPFKQLGKDDTYPPRYATGSYVSVNPQRLDFEIADGQ